MTRWILLFVAAWALSSHGLGVLLGKIIKAREIQT